MGVGMERANCAANRVAGGSEAGSSLRSKRAMWPRGWTNGASPNPPAVSVDQERAGGSRGHGPVGWSRPGCPPARTANPDRSARPEGPAPFDAFRPLVSSPSRFAASVPRDPTCYSPNRRSILGPPSPPNANHRALTASTPFRRIQAAVSIQDGQPSRSCQSSFSEHECVSLTRPEK